MEPTIIIDELYARLGDDDVLVLDCRGAEDWVRFEAQIPGALRMTAAEIALDLAILPDDELIILCGCAVDGADTWELCRLLRAHGRDAVCLSGGLLAWMGAGYPTERHPAAPPCAPP
ncbi:rhodanese-like domain-containing protein [Corallococcus sp. M34]|uniref:rhodanese-like domain-containing protein n=1 Tax=Citreicoccus inhibens TaxID=2849499 RepID=UPI001C24EA31|nr:rhodanese-like domain-containing protein [Citreicoccus inhibens]MBU8900070.1 rhodanese-like domain-containing protein [Citreicoccus inhibens]